MKTTQKGFIIPLLIVIIAVLAIGGGVYIHSQNQKIAEQAVVNTDASIETSVPPLKDFSATPPSNVSVNTNNQPGVDTHLSDEAAVIAMGKFLNNTKFVLSGGVYKSKDPGGGTTDVRTIVKGDLNSDGYEDAVVHTGFCGASCGNSLNIVLNQKNNTGKALGIIFPLYLTGGVNQSNATNININNGVISVTANFEDGSEINHYTLQGDALVVETSAVDVLPTSIGQCVITKVVKVGNRLQESIRGPFIAGSGSAIFYSNSGYQVSYNQLAGIDTSRTGDQVRLCLKSLPQNCPAGDNRGKVYTAINLRTNTSWEAADAEHSCGGA